MIEKSKRGPFRDQGGRSTIMDRSAHIMYRMRRGVFEITVRRGAINAEFNQLNMHRMHHSGTRVTIIKGSKRYRLGLLSEQDLNYLMQLIGECVDEYAELNSWRSAPVRAPSTRLTCTVLISK